MKAGTVRVLILLRNQYQSEDKVDAELIKETMESDIVNGMRNNILWRPDQFEGQIEDKQLILILFLYLILTKINNRSWQCACTGSKLTYHSFDIYGSRYPVT